MSFYSRPGFWIFILAILMILIGVISVETTKPTTPWWAWFVLFIGFILIPVGAIVLYLGYHNKTIKLASEKKIKTTTVPSDDTVATSTK